MTDVVFWDTLSTVASTSTAVSNRAGEVGMGYVQHPLYTVRSLAFDSQGRFYPNSTTGTAQYYVDRHGHCAHDRVPRAVRALPSDGQHDGHC
jgi:hypothetical protein